MARALGDLAIGLPIRRLRAEFPKVQIEAFVQWSEVLLERLASRSLDAAVVLLPEGSTPPVSLIFELLGKQPISVIAAKSARFSQPATFEELSSHAWVLNPHECGARRLIESQFRQRGLPFILAAEAEGYELQFSLISEGLGLGFATPQIFQSSAFRKHIKLVKVKNFSPVQCVWLLHSKNIGRLAPAVRCLRDAVVKQIGARKLGSL